MRETVNEVRIRGRAEQVVALAFDLPRWPEFLPHYRWVRVLEQEGERQTVEMACRAHFGPLSVLLAWRSHLWVRPAEGRMRFRHIAGPARGLEVEWQVRQEGPEVRVTIRHDLAPGGRTRKTAGEGDAAPLLRTGAGRWAVGALFVARVAGRTLAALKQAVEAEAAAEGVGR